MESEWTSILMENISTIGLGKLMMFNTLTLRDDENILKLPIVRFETRHDPSLEEGN